MSLASRLSFVSITLISVILIGCGGIVATPLAGGIYTGVKWGNTATDASGASKEGKACGTSILGWVATGDASVQAAKAAGGISTVSSVDHSSTSILGLWGEFCTIVRGN